MNLRAARDAVGAVLVVALLAILFINPFAPMGWSVGFIALVALAWIFFHFAYRKKAAPAKPLNDQARGDKTNASADDVA